MKIFRKNVEIYDIRPEDSSQQRVVHMGDNVLSLTFCTVEPLDLRVNDTVIFENVTYKFKTLSNPTRKSRYEFEYVCRLYAPQYDLQDVVFVFEDETGVGVLDENIPIFGDVHFHLTQIVKCVKKVYPAWSVGDVTQTTEQKNITYTDIEERQPVRNGLEVNADGDLGRAVAADLPHDERPRPGIVVAGIHFKQPLCQNTYSWADLHWHIR